MRRDEGVGSKVPRVAVLAHAKNVSHHDMNLSSSLFESHDNHSDR